MWTGVTSKRNDYVRICAIISYLMNVSGCGLLRVAMVWPMWCNCAWSTENNWLCVVYWNSWLFVFGLVERGGMLMICGKWRLFVRVLLTATRLLVFCSTIGCWYYVESECFQQMFRFKWLVDGCWLKVIACYASFVAGVLLKVIV